VASARTQDHFVRYRITHHRRRKTYARRTSTRRIDTARGDLCDILEQLRFGDTRVTHQANVEVSTDPHAIAHALRDTPDQQKQKSLLDIFVTVDFGRDARRQFRIEGGVRFELGEFSLDAGRELERLVLLLELMDVLSFKVGVGLKAEPETSKARVRDGEEDATNVDDITGRHGSRHIAVEMDCH
jgi:hypothetical protein